MDTVDNKVRVVQIDRVEAHPNADRLDLAHVQGWQCVTQRGVFETGDLAIYIPIDSVLPPSLEAELFPPDSKVTLSKSRVKTIKIRGALSQGMLIPRTVPCLAGVPTVSLQAGEDLTLVLGITHYEPPAAPASMRGDQISKKKTNPFFPTYSKLSHFKNYPDLFDDGESVVVTEKIHGTNFRAGWAPMLCDTWWKKVKRWLHLLPEWEFVVGSHNVQINMEKNQWTGFYPTNVYVETVKAYELESKIPLGVIVYGEIYGPGIQKGYGYGLQHGEHCLVVFDVRLVGHNTEGYITWEDARHFCMTHDLPLVPVIYEGPYHKDLTPSWEQGKSLLSDKQEHREGCVVKPRQEQQCWIGRKMLRSINPEYLLRAESDFH